LSLIIKPRNTKPDYFGGIMEKKTQNWWDKLGKPQYGGEMTIRIHTDINIFDPYYTGHHFQV
jgi:predicted transcriptional regulator